MKEKTDTTLFSLPSPMKKNPNKIWIASTMRLFRNLEKFQFPGKLNVKQRLQIVSLVENKISTTKEFNKGHFFHAQDLSPLEKEFLFEHTLSKRSFHQAQEGEAFILNKTTKLFVLVNVRDHLQFQLTDCTHELEKNWNQLAKVETAFGKYLSYAFSPKYGFLTADPMLCGTGLIIYAFMQIPALIHTGKIESLRDKFLNEGVIFSGMQGDPDAWIGDTFVVHNACTLGLTEEAIISKIRTLTTNIVLEERSSRIKIKQEKNRKIKDLVSRAIGLLKHTYHLEAVETMGAISALKLGLDLNWIAGINIETLNYLFFQCRRAHLLAKNGDTQDKELLLHLRAEFIQKRIKNIEIKL